MGPSLGDFHNSYLLATDEVRLQAGPNLLNTDPDPTVKNVWLRFLRLRLLQFKKICKIFLFKQQKVWSSGRGTNYGPRG